MFNKTQKIIGAAIAVALLVILSIAFWPRDKEAIEPKETPVIVNEAMLVEYDVEYQLLSFATIDADFSEEVSIDSYQLTIVYIDDDQKKRAILIKAPKTGMVTDEALPINTVVWDTPIELEGKTYASARWSPGYMVPARDKPVLTPGEPLTKKR